MEHGTGAPDNIRRIIKPERKPGEPETFPSVENQPSASGTLIEHVVGQAKRDLTSTTDADIDATLAEIENIAVAERPLVSKHVKEADADLKSARFEQELSGPAVRDARSIEKDFADKYGVDIAHPENNRGYKRLLHGAFKALGMLESYKYAKEEAVFKTDSSDRDYRLTALAEKSPEARAAVAMAERGVADMRLAIIGEYGVSPDQHENVGEANAEFGRLLETDAKFQADVRRYNVAAQELDMLNEKYDLGE